MSLADIFGWDIDFAHGIRKGDMFAVVIDRIYLNSKHTNSVIKYAIFQNRKNIKVAYRYNKKYFNAKGRSLQKQFLRAPIDSYRISSHFNKKRLHPIFKTTRPHLGTDYAAPRGTPIYSTGEGVIIHKGRKGGYGNTVIIKHGNIYSTLYAHLSKYRKGLRVGKKVKQKDTKLSKTKGTKKTNKRKRRKLNARNTLPLFKKDTPRSKKNHSIMARE